MNASKFIAASMFAAVSLTACSSGSDSDSTQSPAVINTQTITPSKTTPVTSAPVEASVSLTTLDGGRLSPSFPETGGTAVLVYDNADSVTLESRSPVLPPLDAGEHTARLTWRSDDGATVVNATAVFEISKGTPGIETVGGAGMEDAPWTLKGNLRDHSNLVSGIITVNDDASDTEIARGSVAEDGSFAIPLPARAKGTVVATLAYGGDKNNDPAVLKNVRLKWQERF